jgi:HSP20 family molecular chaperone IbpA
MQKQIHFSTKVLMLLASLMGTQMVRSDFGLDGALQEMTRSVEKIQKKFTKINNSMHISMNNFMQGAFSAQVGTLTIAKQDAHVVITVAMNDLDKDSIKAVVHNNVLTVNARNKQTEMELVVDVHSAQLNMQQKVEVASEEVDKNGDKKSSRVSFSSQQNKQSLPVEVGLNDVAVEYENGVLTVKLSRVEPVVSPKVIQVIKK